MSVSVGETPWMPRKMPLKAAAAFEERTLVSQEIRASLGSAALGESNSALPPERGPQQIRK